MNADVKAAEEILDFLDKLTVEENYLPEQVFYIEEISLFWKWCWRTFIHEKAKSVPGFKAYKNGMTGVFGVGVVGYKSKPFLIWHSNMPRVFKHINKHTLPACFRSSRKSCIVQMASWSAMSGKYRALFGESHFSKCYLMLVVLQHILFYWWYSSQ